MTKSVLVDNVQTLYSIFSSQSTEFTNNFQGYCFNASLWLGATVSLIVRAVIKLFHLTVISLLGYNKHKWLLILLHCMLHK